MLEQPLLFTGCSSVQFFNSPPIPKHGRPGHLWYPTTRCVVLVWLTGRHATIFFTKYFPPNLYLERLKVSLGVASILKMCLCLNF